MAFLGRDLFAPIGRTTLFVLQTAALLSCHGGGEVGTMDVERFEQVVHCPDRDFASPCFDPNTGAEVVGEGSRSWVFLSTRVGAIDRSVLLYGEVAIPRGAGFLEIEAHPYQPETESRLQYVEVQDGVVSFRSESYAGMVELPEERLDEGCECSDVRFELLFRAAGEDGELNTDDDPVRRLSRGHATRDDLCIQPRRAIVDDEFYLSYLDLCPETVPPPSRGPSTAPPPEERVTTGTTTSASCNSDGGGCESDGGGCESDGGGCESDGGGCESDSSSGGCESDSDGGGCDGDSGGDGCDSDGGDGCDPDSAAAPVSCDPRRPSRLLISGRAQFIFLMLAVLLSIRRRAQADMVPT
ncbi:MAG: hypothetical protein AAGE52_23865 [Myxococcota bacterium]